MKEIITKLQASEMGYGYGYLEDAEGNSLKDILDFYTNPNQFVNKISIYDKDKLIYTEDFNHKIKEVKFKYCHQQKDVDIYLD